MLNIRDDSVSRFRMRALETAAAFEKITGGRDGIGRAHLKVPTARAYVENTWIVSKRTVTGDGQTGSKRNAI